MYLYFNEIITYLQILERNSFLIEIISLMYVINVVVLLLLLLPAQPEPS